MKPFFMFSLLVATLASQTSFAVISINCGTGIDRENFTVEKEVFSVGGEDPFEGPAIKDAYWGISIDGEAVYGKNITAETVKENGHFVDRFEISVKGERVSSGYLGKKYIVQDPYSEEPTLEIWTLGGGIVGPQLLEEFECLSSSD